MTDSIKPSLPSSWSPNPDSQFEFLPPKDLFTVQEAAQFLNCTVRTVRNMIRDSRLEAVKIKGGYIRIPRSALLAAFEACH
jgi:excisionase family DNA binding protein